MDDEKPMRAAMTTDGAFAGIAAFHPVPTAPPMAALPVYAAMKFQYRPVRRQRPVNERKETK
jgi:hypothetical protein